MLRSFPLLLVFSLFALLNCFVSWSHQNKEVFLADNLETNAWNNYRGILISDPDLAAFYSFQDEHLKFGLLRNRKTIFPTTLADLKTIDNNQVNKHVGRIVHTRWAGKQGIELDNEYLRLPVNFVSQETFTLSFWIRQNGLGSIKGKNFDAAGSLITLGDGVRSGWRLDLLVPSNRIIFQLAPPKGQQESGVCGTLRLPPKTWINVTISRSSTRIRVYVNGLIVGEREHHLAPTALAPTSSLKVGYAGNGISSSLFQIDELTIWANEKTPYEILNHAFCMNLQDEKLRQTFDRASNAFSKFAHQEALRFYQECLDQDALPTNLRAVVQLRIGEILAILGDKNKALTIFSQLSSQINSAAAIRSHALHELLYLQEQKNNPEELELSFFSVANSNLYGELSTASTNYTNAMIEYDFLTPVD